MSDDRILPGSVWVERGKMEYKTGETPRRPRLWLVLRGPHKHRPNNVAIEPRVQVELMHLESGGTRRVNVTAFRARGNKRAWEKWLDPPTEPEQTEPEEK